MTLRSRGPSKSRGKSKLLYLHYHNATKRGRMVIYLNGLLTITSCNAFIKWSRKVTGQAKSCFHCQCLWPPMLAGC